MSKPTLQITSDFTDDFNEVIKRFRNDMVLVGIPEEEAQREAGSAEELANGMTNAALLAITNFGSPQANVPAWPVMEIGIRNAQVQIAEEFKKAAKNVLTQGLSALSNYYERIGIIASTSIKKTINSQEQAPPLAESTLAARKASKFSGSKRGIVTGQMRNAITYVVKKGI